MPLEEPVTIATRPSSSPIASSLVDASMPTTLLGMESEQRAALFDACSNAGRWGPDDERGTLNLVTPDKRRHAARLVVEGLSVSMAADLSVRDTPLSDSLKAHTAFSDPAAPIAVADAITLHVHG